MAVIKGTIGNNNLLGTSLGDTLIGGGGNDNLNGGAGSDVAQYVANIADYRFSSVNGKLVVSSLNGAEGKDTLTSIEALQFNNGQLSVTSGEFQVNTFSSVFGDGDEYASSVTGLVGGGFVVTWQAADGGFYGVYAQLYDAAGVAQGGEFRVNGTITGDQSTPSVTALSNGGFVVSWQSNLQDGDGLGIYAQRYDAAGNVQGVEFKVNSYTTSDQIGSSMAGLNDGGFVVTWQSNGQDGALYGVYGQRYDAAGNAQGAEFQVNSYTVSNQSYANVTALADGGFVVTWRSNGQDTSNYGVYGQRYDATGVPQGGEFIVNTYTLDNQQVPSVTALAGGGFVVTWESEGQDGEGYGIYAKRYDVNGLLQGEEFKVNTTSSYHQSNASIAALADGGFVVAWQSQAGFDIFAQRYNAAGVPQGGEFQVNTLDVLYSYEPSITALADGGFVVSWSSFDGNDDEVYAQRYDANGNAVGTKLTGTGNADLINLDSGNAGLIVDGGAGNDTINGAGANDSVLGGEGNDVLNGGAGDDYLNGNFGVDKLNGGAGDDVYVIDTGGGADIITELAGQGIDSVQSIINYTLTTNVENLSLKGSATLGVGNALGNAIEGNAQYNLLDGKAGSDVLDGASGNDTLIGGLGNDLLEGGIGNDVFKFNTALSALNNVDTIVDFSVLDDTIQLSKAIFTTISAGSAAGIALNSTMFNSGAFNVAQDASDRIIYNSSTGDLYYDKDGTGASVAIKFAHLDAGLSLTNADFSVIL